MAYRTIGVPVDPRVVADVAAGGVRALLVTSGSVAQQVQDQLGPVPEQTLIACIGPRTAKDAAAVGLRVDVIADERSTESLIEALVLAAHPADRRRLTAPPPPYHPSPNCEFVSFPAPGKDTNSQFGEGRHRVDG